MKTEHQGDPMELKIKAFSLTCAIFAAVGIFFMFLLTWWFLLTGSGYGAMTLIENVYLGYSMSSSERFIGLCWGFFDGLAAGAVFTWLYTRIQSFYKNKRLRKSQQVF